jgi:hypothetical protein
MIHEWMTSLMAVVKYCPETHKMCSKENGKKGGSDA